MAYDHETKKEDDSQERQTQKADQETQKFDESNPDIEADKDVLPSDEAEDDIDVEIVLENLAPDEVVQELSEYTDDEDVLDDFAERQQFNTGGGNLLGKLKQYNQESPDLSAGDIDAAWDTGNQTGEETLAGDSPTPDQDNVDYEGLAAGLTYGLEEPLNSDKVNERDRHRWELNPKSADDENQKKDIQNMDIEVDPNQGTDEDVENP